MAYFKKKFVICILFGGNTSQAYLISVAHLYFSHSLSSGSLEIAMMFDKTDGRVIGVDFKVPVIIRMGSYIAN